MELRVGVTAGEAGFRAGAIGALETGRWPCVLFTDGQARTVDLVVEGVGAEGPRWWLGYSGGAADAWQTASFLDNVVMAVEYADGVDNRSFHLGGFATGQARLLLEPPIPSTDWQDRDGQVVRFTFTRLVAVPPPPIPSALVAPPTEPDSFVEWLSETTPGGPVMAQVLITVLVFVGFMLTAPATSWGLFLSAVVLVMTPWVPTFWGFGSTLAASIVFINVALGSYCYKVYVARTEA